MNRIRHAGTALLLIVAVLATSLALVGLSSPEAGAGGPAYAGPQTESDTPAYFGPAPNPLPYCESPTYFDPWVDNVTPLGRLDVGDTALAVAPGMTMVLEIDGEGDPGGQYPGFFPFDGEGVDNDQAKGFEVGPGDSASVTLSQPLFYPQFIFTDVDRPGEGFEVTPDWAVAGEVVVSGGDSQFSFEDSTNALVVLDDLDGVLHQAESIDGRVQLDLLGAVNGISFERPATHIDPDSGLEVATEGESGLAAVAGCEASGSAKSVVAGPTWNGETFEVTYELRVRNNMPTEQTVLDVVETAQANAQSTFLTAAPSSMAFVGLSLQDQLGDEAFSVVTVTDVSSATPNLILNEDFDGLVDDELLDAGSFLAAESDGLVNVTVEYTPDAGRSEWAECVSGVTHSSQAEVSGTVAGIAVSDLSDDGSDPAPSSINGSGGVDDPTPVVFPCVDADLEIVKTAISGPTSVCPDFASGVVGEGPALPVFVDDVVTYCISVRNAGLATANAVTVTDPQAPNSFDLGSLASGQGQAISYDIQVDVATPGLNTATVNGTSAMGALEPTSDAAAIIVSPKPQPDLEIVKTVLPGPGVPCPSFDGGELGRGTPFAVADQDTVTYCITVRNVGAGDATNVVISDDQAPQDYAIGTVVSGQQVTVGYLLTVNLATPRVNIAFVDGDGPSGSLERASDDAEIVVSPSEPELEIVKTALVGPLAQCPGFAGGVAGPGRTRQVDDGDTVTFCISVRNLGPGTATDVTVDDDQAPAPFALGTLASGAEQTVSYDIVVDLDTPATNTATADGGGPAGALEQIEDTAVIAVRSLPEPALEIVKTAMVGPNANCPDFDDGTAGQGDAVDFVETETVTYCISVRNVGSGDATGVIITDAQAPDAFDLTVGTLSAGTEATRSFDLQVSLQTEPVNVASVDGVGPYGPVSQVSDDALISVELQPDPVLEIVKTAVHGPSGNCPTFFDGEPGDGTPLVVLFGDVVTYCLAVINSGESDALSVQIEDQQAPGAFSIGALAVDEEAGASYDVTVGDQTPQQNTATVAGAGPNGQLDEATDTAIIESSPQPDPVLEIVKTAVEGPNGTCPTFDTGVVGDGDALEVFHGDVVTYCISVRNTGERPATSVTVTDEQAPQTYTFATLNVNGSETRSYDVTVDADTAEANRAVVSGSGPNGQVPQGADTAIIAALVQLNPQLNIVKAVVPGPAGECPSFDQSATGIGDVLHVDHGDTVTYCLSVRNTGPRDAANVVITDDQAPTAFTVGSLATDETADRSYDVVITADTPLLNVATVSGDGPNGALPEDNDSARVETAEVELAHTVIRSDSECSDTVQDVDVLVVDLVGQEVRWCYLMTNTGSVPLTNVLLSSSGIGFTDLDVLENAGRSYVLDDVGNLQQTGSVEAQPAGDVHVGSANAEPGDVVLMPGDSVTIDLSTLIPPGGFVSTTTVVADPSDVDGNVLDLGPISATGEAAVREGQVALDKTVAAGTDADCASATQVVAVQVGDPVTWCFTVTNTGTLDLGLTEIVDETLALVIAVPPADQVLAPGASFTVSAAGESTGPIVNQASIEARSLHDDGSVVEQAPTVRDEDTAEIRVPQADLSITKAVSDTEPVFTGAVLNYTLEVTNDGPDAAVGVQVSDVLPAGMHYLALPNTADWACSRDGDEGFVCSKGTAMASDESATLFYTVEVVSSAATGGTREDIATVDAITSDPDDTNNTDLEAIQTEVLVDPSAPIVAPPINLDGFDDVAAPPINLVGFETTDEPFGLALTGSSARQLGLLSLTMIALGVALMVGSRRSRRGRDV